MLDRRMLAGLILLLAMAAWLSALAGQAAAQTHSKPLTSPRAPAAQSTPARGPAAQPAPAPTLPAESTRQAALDAAITARVKAALMADADLKLQTIHVDTVNATVILSGIVDSSFKSEAARTLVIRVDGVKSVDNRLAVEGATAAAARIGNSA